MSWERPNDGGRQGGPSAASASVSAAVACVLILFRSVARHSHAR